MEAPMIDGYSIIGCLCNYEKRKVWIAKNNKTEQHEIITMFNNMKLNGEQFTLFKERFENLKKVNHPALLPPDSFQIPKNNNKCILIFTKTPTTLAVSEYLQTKTNNKYDVIRSLIFSIGVISAINYLHYQNIVCFDLSFNSILTDANCYPYLVAFGTYYLFPSYEPEPIEMESITIAPELQKNFEPNIKTDIFALSMILCRFFCKSYKFKPDCDGVMSFKLKTGYRPLFELRTPLFIRIIIEYSWNNDPSMRLNTDQIQHQYLAGCKLYNSIANSQRTRKYFALINKFLKSSELDLLGPVAKCESLSNKGKNIAIRYILLQDCVNMIDEKNYNKILTDIKSSLKPKKDTKHIYSIFWFAAKIRYQKLTLLAKLLHDLIGANYHFSKVPYLILKKLFNEIMISDPIPLMNSRVAFVRYLYNHEMFKSSEIIEKIQKAFANPFSRINSLLPFCWFADVLYTQNRQFFDDVMKFFHENVYDDFFPQAYIDFYNDIDFYMKNNWEFYRQSLANGLTKDELTNAVRADDMSLFNKYANTFEMPVRIKLLYSVFEVCPLLKNDLFIQLYSMAYGSIKIYHQFFQNYCNILSTEKAFKKSAILAAASGNESIHSSIRLSGYKHDESVYVATEFHQNSLFETMAYGQIDLSKNDRFGHPIITIAAASNNIYVLLRCINAGESVNTIGAFNRTALHEAAFNGCVECISILLNVQGIDVNKRDAFGCTAFFIACERGNIDAAKKLLKNENVNKNLTNENGQTPFMAAAMSGNKDLMKSLLSLEGIKYNHQMDNGQTALHLAASMDLSMFKYMMKHSEKLDKSIADNKGRKAIDIAQKQGFDIRKLSN